jgi:hypothetical protein
MRTALVKDGVVQNVVLAGPGYEPPDGFVAVPNETVNVGHRHNGKDFSVPGLQEFANSEDDFFLLAVTAENCKRNALNNACIVIAGKNGQQIILDSTEDDRHDLADYAHLAALDPNFSASLVQAQPHGTVTLDAAQILAARAEMATLTVRCQAALHAVIEAIKIGRIITLEQVYAPETVAGAPPLEGWPKPLRSSGPDEAPAEWKAFLASRHGR